MKKWTFFVNQHGETSTAAISPSQDYSPVEMTSGVDFKELGISNPPSWSVLFPDDAGGTKLVQVPQVPEVEGLPLPPGIEVIASVFITHTIHSIKGLDIRCFTAGASQICL